MSASSPQGRILAYSPLHNVPFGACTLDAFTIPWKTISENLSLILERREETYDPPKDKGEWMKRWIADRKPVEK